jgi:hypothetical protein
MSGGVPELRPALPLKSSGARRIEINTRIELAVAAGLLVLVVAMGGDSFVIAMVMWLLYA